MAEDAPFDLVLEHLKRIQGKLDALSLDNMDIKMRLSSLESGQALIHQEIAHLATSHAAQNVRTDRLEERIGRIERRLDLREA